MSIQGSVFIRWMDIGTIVFGGMWILKSLPPFCYGEFFRTLITQSFMFDEQLLCGKLLFSENILKICKKIQKKKT